MTAKDVRRPYRMRTRRKLMLCEGDGHDPFHFIDMPTYIRLDAHSKRMLGDEFPNLQLLIVADFYRNVNKNGLTTSIATKFKHYRRQKDGMFKFIEKPAI